MANAALLSLKMRLFDLLMPLDALAFSQGQTEILDPGCSTFRRRTKCSRRAWVPSTPVNFAQIFISIVPVAGPALSLERFQRGRPA